MGFFIALLIIPIIIFAIFYPVYLGLITHKDLILKRLAKVDALLINRRTVVVQIMEMVEDKMINDEAIVSKVRKNLIDSNKLKRKWNNNEERFNLENQFDIDLDIFLTKAMEYPQLKDNVYLTKTLNEFIAVQTLLMPAIKEFNTTLSNYQMLIKSPPGTILAPMLKVSCDFVPYYIPQN